MECDSSSQLVSFLTNWGPVIAFLVAFAFLNKGNGKAVDRSIQICEEMNALSRKTQALAEEQLEVLKQIKTLLEDRKS